MSNNPVDKPISYWQEQFPSARLGGLELSGRIRLLEDNLIRRRALILEPLGLDPKEWDVLSALWRNRSHTVSMSDLSAELLVVAGSVTNRVSGLERRGFVERKIDPASRRRVLVTLTEAGMERVETTLPVIIEESARIDSLMTHQALTDLNSLLALAYAALRDTSA